MISKSLFGNRLKEKRKFLGLTQAQAAEKAGIERETWGKYERGVFMPSGDVLLSFLNMGIDVSSLFAAEMPMPSENLGISKEENELLVCYRQASDLGRAVILSAARGAEKKAAKDHQVSAADKTA
ncbi:helix-turn-helix transcriptional regulator [Neisseria musculi]|uniref:Helix-turn-helix family protein n=1 Tax=Neisseria musculi TaxID=1815583 RepID=A0A7H1MC89_9NEIS|nr:helix-turn-helix transcriptional regulator [Neisseria musculi]QNT59254.1 helix-turn-helix domain protein [Neisseria musculi]